MPRAPATYHRCVSAPAPTVPPAAGSSTTTADDQGVRAGIRWLLDRLDPAGRALPRLAWASLVTNILLVVTGGAVRLTGSGLGCPTWPSCTEDSLVNTPAYGIHGYVEFGNRLLTFVLTAVALATFVVALLDRLARRRGPASFRLALALLLGIPLQAVIGGITVLTKLNPWVVMLHFLASMLLVGLATWLVRRSQEADVPARPVVPPAVPGLAVAVLATLVAVLYVGAIVTGSGPHAGDAQAHRTGLDPRSVSQLHADLVFLLVGLTVGLWVLLLVLGAPAPARRAAALLLGVELAQGVVGFVQYFTHLPVVLVAAHMLGAALLTAVAVHVLLTLRTRPALALLHA